MNHITNAYYKVVFNQPVQGWCGVKDLFGQFRRQTILKQCTAGEADYGVCRCGAVYPYATYKGLESVGISTLDCPVMEAMEQAPIQP